MLTIGDNNEAKLKIQKSQKELGKLALNLSKQPGYEYLAELDKKNEINWVQVQLIQEHFKFEQEGLTPLAAALITLAVTAATGGTGASLAGVSGASSSALANTAFTAMTREAALSFANNKGNLGQTLKDMGSKDILTRIVVETASAGLNPMPSGLPAFNLSNASIQVISALNPEVGQALALVNGSRANSVNGFLGNMAVNYGKHKATEELDRFAKKNGLTLGELNLMLQLNSQLGLAYAGTTVRKGIDASGVLNVTIEGFLSREAHSNLGLFWDLNDTLLNLQNINDAVSLGIIYDGYRGPLSGHSLGAARANNLVYTGWNESANVYSLPIFAIPAPAVKGECVASDAICGGFFLSIFRDNTTTKDAVSYIDWFNKSHVINTAYPNFPGKEYNWDHIKTWAN